MEQHTVAPNAELVQTVTNSQGSSCTHPLPSTTPNMLSNIATVSPIATVTRFIHIIEKDSSEELAILSEFFNEPRPTIYICIKVHTFKPSETSVLFEGIKIKWFT